MIWKHFQNNNEILKQEKLVTRVLNVKDNSSKQENNV